MTTYEMRRIAEMQAEFLVEALKKDDELLDMMFPPKLMSIEDASKFTGIPVGTLYQKIDQIPHMKSGKRLVFSDRGLMRWLNRKPSVMVELEVNKERRKVM